MLEQSIKTVVLMINGREMLMGNEGYTHEYLNIDELVQKADHAKHSGFKFTYLYKCKVDTKDSMIYCRIPNNIRIKNKPYDPANFSDILFTGTL